ncbi:MAG: pyruvate kinase [Ignisphaera sp.]
MFVKKIASLGPSSSSYEIIRSMVEFGIDGFRINFAHGDPNEWKMRIEYVRKAEAELGKPLPIIGDIQGPSIRIGEVSNPIVLKKGDTVRFILGSTTTNPNTVPIVAKKFFDIIEVGDIIIMDDGRTRLRVVDRGSNYVDVVALTESVIKSRKTLTIQAKEIDMPILSDRDLMCIKFAVENDVDYIGLSYVRKAEDVENVRDILKRYGRGDIGIIAKIETKSAVKNLDDIVEVSDAVLVARGDLGMNFGLEEIHHLQKLVVDKCLKKRTPVIVATQLLESMIENPVPTRAEVVDVSIAIEMGVDALMLTGETSAGKYPLEAVKWLKKIVDFVESHIHKSIDEVSSRARERLEDLRLRFTKGVLELAEDIDAKLFVFSMYGNTAKRISSLRPRVPIYVASPNIHVLRKLSILWGLNLLHVEAESYEEGMQKMLEKAIESGLVSYGELAVLTYGLREPKQRVEILRIGS